MDPVSISGTMVALFQLTDSILSFLDSVKSASSEQKKLRDEVITVMGLLTIMEKRVKAMKAHDEGCQTIRVLAESSILDQCKESLEELIGKTDNDEVSGIKKFGRNLTWHFGKIEVNKTLMSVERLKTLLNLASMNDVGILTQKIKVDSEMLISDVAEIKEGLERQKIDKECQVVGDWLSPFDFNVTQQEILEKCHTGTGKWMLESDEFQQWLSSHDKTLWCPGIPGAGKTYLASIVIDYLQQQTSSEGLSTVLCLFCNFNAQANQTAYKFMGTLLKQLARASRTLPSGIKDIYDKRENVRESDFKVLADAFRTEIKKYSKTFIVIDALDEVSESADIRTMLLEELRSCPINLLVTSRHDPTIRRQFSEAQHYEIHATNEDIRSYVSGRMALENRLSRHIRSVPSLEDEIPARIVGSAKGMFLLARFHMDEISNKTKPRHIGEALEKLPQGLNDNYARTIDRIKSQGSDCWDLAQKVLLWLSNALKPLSLGELQEAVAVETGMTSIGTRDLDDTESLISACAGLVVLESGKKTSVPRLVHYTLQEYLNKNPAILSPNSHAVIARKCLAFLSFDDFSNELPHIWLRCGFVYGHIVPPEPAVPYSPYHFTCYAASFWGFHAQRAGETEEVIHAALDFLSRPANVAYNWLVIVIEKSVEDGLRAAIYLDLLKDATFFGLLFAVHFALKGVLVELLKRHRRPADLSRLAWYAARLGYKEIIRLLLAEEDVDWNKDLFGYIDGFDGKSLLMLVAEWDTGEALRTILQKEYGPVNALVVKSALHWATRYRCTSIAQTLLEAGADVQACWKGLGGVISELNPYMSGRESWEEMMDLLLKYGADVNARGMLGDTALHDAARETHFGTYAVEYLVSRGASLNLLSLDGETPLDKAEFKVEFYALPYPFEQTISNRETAAKIVQILREAGGKTAKELVELGLLAEQDPPSIAKRRERWRTLEEDGYIHDGYPGFAFSGQ